MRLAPPMGFSAPDGPVHKGTKEQVVPIQNHTSDPVSLQRGLLLGYTGAPAVDDEKFVRDWREDASKLDLPGPVEEDVISRETIEVWGVGADDDGDDNHDGIDDLGGLTDAVPIAFPSGPKPPIITYAPSGGLPNVPRECITHIKQRDGELETGRISLIVLIHGSP